MPHGLFLFLDGVGLGTDDPDHNPLATAHLPTLTGLLDGRRWLADTGPIHSAAASFAPISAHMGVAGLPQSASGQASIVTGQNVPARLGKHWGPKPNAAIREIVQHDSLFIQLRQRGQTVALANAYPPGYFAVTDSGRRLHGTIPTAMLAAGVPLYTVDDLRAGRGVSADWTGDGWRSELKISDVPVETPFAVGQRLARHAREMDLLFVDHWVTDYIGHRGTLADAVQMMETFDGVLAGVLSEWDLAHDVIVITSDHGNMEDFRHNHHTDNAVPAMWIGGPHAELARPVHDLTGFAPVLNAFLK